VPFNDAESQGSFLVNIPDVVSSSSSIQIQRGVGTSTNGTGAFGGSINIQTNDIDTIQSFSLRNTAGSYQTLKHTFLFNSGLMHNQFVVSFRASHIQSNGYVDRGKSKLQSIYLSLAQIKKKHSLRFNLIAGKEKTYASWFGIDQATLDTNRRYNPAGSEKTGGFYDNETDNYKQIHYQFFYNQQLKRGWKMGTTLFATTGKGYFEQYKANQLWDAYNIKPIIQNNDTITQSDLVRQLWLDNIFYGINYGLEYVGPKNKLTIGGTVNRYDGKHFGIVTTLFLPEEKSENNRWYNLNAQKTEQSIFIKGERRNNSALQSFVDVQIRNVQYQINGFRNNPNLILSKRYTFLNPKFGISYAEQNWKWYFSFARGAKEPNRDDFEAGIRQQPKPEYLNDWEMGLSKKSKKMTWELNAFYMQYKDQLVLTGKVNDVFAYTRTNIDKSYRVGIEISTAFNLLKHLTIEANATLSENMALDYTEYTDDYDAGIQQTQYFERTPLAFSPSFQGSSTLTWRATKRMGIMVFSKYCGKQFLDNTGDDSKTLSSYAVHDVKIDYNLFNKKKISIEVYAQVNNLLSAKYTPNGYTYSYIYANTLYKNNFYYPMATRNYLIGIHVNWKK
jgi:iron complex outermembrane receptor protein